MDRLDRMDRMERMQRIERIESPKYFRDRRKHPRVCMDLPLEYLANQALRARGGIVVDASETGFLIYSTEDIPVGTNLKIDVLFPRDMNWPISRFSPKSFGERLMLGKGRTPIDMD